MRRNIKLQNYEITKLENSQRGYMLIVLLLAVALMAMALLAVLPRVEQQIRRDQEEEMRHRGTEYMRAIQHFYRKFNRYPTRVEELENTNNLRFLRKRYKDPITGKDFKLLHMQDVTLNNGPVLGAGAGPGGLGGQGGPLGQGGGFGSGGGFGQGGAFGSGGAGGLGRGGPFSGQQNQQQTGGDNSDTGTSGGSQSNPNQGSTGSSSSSSSSSDSSGSSGSSSSGNPNSGTLGAGFGQTFGGGPILGVASTSKKQSIREFNKKNHYNDWLFIYDPTSDRGGLLVGPWQTGTTQGMGGMGIGQPVQNISRPVGGMGPGGSSPFGGQQPTPQQPQQNQPQSPGEEPENE